MHTGQIITSAIYALAQISGGLLLHPYQTMQSLVRDRVFVWMTLLPSAILALVTVFWRFILVPIVQLFFSCSAASFVGCQWLPFISNWITLFSLYWQILLFYLLVRFSQVYKG